MPAVLVELITDSHFWVGIAFVIFLFVMYQVGVHKLAWNALGESGVKVQAQLDEANDLRDEAMALLARIKLERDQAEIHAREMLASAEEEAARLQIEAKASLDEQIKRRAALAERKIANAEAQAQAEVKAAAADMAAHLTEQVLVARLGDAKNDPLIDIAISQVGARLQ